MEDVRQSRIVVRGYMQQYDLEQLGISKADATVENIEAAAILIISGAYIGFLPVHFAEQWVKTGEMRRLGASGDSFVACPDAAAELKASLAAPLDAAIMREAAQALVGRHDFTSFRSAECQAASPVRELRELSVVRRGRLIRVRLLQATVLAEPTTIYKSPALLAYRQAGSVQYCSISLPLNHLRLDTSPLGPARLALEMCLTTSSLMAHGPMHQI